MKVQKTSTRRKSRTAPRRNPELMEELVTEILLRLPVKSLRRFESVCKAWRSIISDPIFIRAHLRHSASKWVQNPCFIINPHTLDTVVPEEEECWPRTFSSHLRFYKCQLQCDYSPKNNVATFLHAKDFNGEFNSLRYFKHCDGLVFAPTDTRLYVFNPATRESITLPDGYQNSLRVGGQGCCYCAGLGLDSSTGKYKVVQAFYRSVDPSTNMWTDMGMEVFTIAGDNGGDWREIASDPPYPVERFQTAVTVNGFLFWRIAKRHPERLRAILHLSLEEEEFGITRLPDSLDPSLDAFVLDVLYGRDLCLTACTSETTLTIWTLPAVQEGLNSPWERRYSIEFESSMPCHTLSLPPFSNGIVLWRADTVYCYDPATSELTALCELNHMRYQGVRTWKNLFTFNFNPFTESLVRITSS
ncbi:unnamed protein product [Urochloa decumbens]|uniref:F-box domain-containing protein n=1 Tax=Urochloa decumbens TaxID=240449 RepID=A0ABC8VA52_9POAL